MIIATSTDSSFVELASALLASLAVNGGTRIKRVYCFCQGLNSKERINLEASGKGLELRLLDVDKVMGRRLAAFRTRGRMSAITYLRIYIPEIIAEEHGRLLYLDSDMIVNRSLDELADLDLAGHVLGAVEDVAPRAERNARLGSPPDTPYFNAGLLLIDLDRWREHNITKRILATISERRNTLKFMDQDALNATFRGDWLILGRTWNFYQTSTKRVFTETAEAFRAAHILHFLGKVKPNETDSIHPATDVFLAYRRLTPYAERPLHTPANRKLRHLRAEILQGLRLLNPFKYMV
jgi:lipopolysaccharide biosynthesis glycosyltransferase